MILEELNEDSEELDNEMEFEENNQVVENSESYNTGPMVHVPNEFKRRHKSCVKMINRKQKNMSRIMHKIKQSSIFLKQRQLNNSRSIVKTSYVKSQVRIAQNSKDFDQIEITNMSLPNQISKDG